MMRRAVLLGFGTLCCLLVWSCGDGSPTGPGDGEEQKRDVTPAAVAVASGDAQTGPAGSKLPNPLSVKVTSRSGAAVSGATVAWQVSAGGGSLSAASSTTDAQGLAQVEWTLGTTVGENAATATVGTLAPVSFKATAKAGEPARVQKVKGDAQTDTTRAVLPDTLVVLVSDAHGNPVPGAAVAWAVAKGNGAVAAMAAATDSAGHARARWTLGPGDGENVVTVSVGSLTPVTFTATGRTPVAAVRITPESLRLSLGVSRQFTAAALDAAGNALPGRSIAWSTTNAEVVSVSATGLVTARSLGAATVRATSEGKSAGVQVTAVRPTAARVKASPEYAVIDVGQKVQITAVALDANGDTIRNPSVGLGWSSTVVRHDSPPYGSFTGVGAGFTSVVVTVDEVRDTSFVAVLGPRSLLSTALVGGAIRAQVQPGALVTVPIVLDLGKVGADGDLGSADLTLSYDAGVLEYVSAAVDAKGSGSLNLARAGTFRLSFASTAVQGARRFTLATVTFRVAANASPGTEQAFGLSYTERPTDTSFNTLDIPVTAGGRIRVVAP